MPCADELLQGPDGQIFQVINTQDLDFSHAVIARRSRGVRVRFAVVPERVRALSANGQIETETIAEPGCAIFQDITNDNDQYVPRDSEGRCWTRDIVSQKGYLPQSQNADGSVIMLHQDEAEFLLEVLTAPSVLKDVFGPGQHQFLSAGDGLKRSSSGNISGIQRQAFERNWTVITESE